MKLLEEVPDHIKAEAKRLISSAAYSDLLEILHQQAFAEFVSTGILQKDLREAIYSRMVGLTSFHEALTNLAQHHDTPKK